MTYQVPDIEQVINDLLAYLAGLVSQTFNASGTNDSATLTGVDDFAGLAKGLPVWGPNVPEGTFISALDSGAGTITLSQALAGDVSAQDFGAGFQTTGRRVKHWNQVAAQPALFIRHTGDDDVWMGEGLCETYIELEVWIYAKTGQDPDAVPDTGLNYLARAIRVALQPDDGEGGEFTMGGAVYRCRIEGRSEFDPGDQDSQGKALIPIKILLP